MTNTTVRTAQFINVLLFALVMGVFWGTWVSLSRSIASIRPETFLEIGHTMIANLGGPMAILMPAALASSIWLLVLFRHRRGGVFNLALVSLLLMVVALVVTLTVNVPIDNQIAQWTPSTLPEDWAATRDRWEWFHGLRTFISIGAVACAVASALVWKPWLAAGQA